MLISIFFTPVFASALLLMHGKKTNEKIITTAVINEYKNYWRGEIKAIIATIKDRIPLAVDDKPLRNEPEGDLMVDDQE